MRIYNQGVAFDFPDEYAGAGLSDEEVLANYPAGSEIKRFRDSSGRVRRKVIVPAHGGYEGVSIARNYFDVDPVSSTSMALSPGLNTFTLATGAGVNEYAYTDARMLRLNGTYRTTAAYPYDRVWDQRSISDGTATKAAQNPHLEFVMDGDAFEIISMGGTQSTLWIKVDGVYTSAAGYPSPPRDGSARAFRCDFSTTAVRRVEIYGGSELTWGMMRVRGTLLDPTRPAAKPLVYVMGDSITEGTGTTKHQNWTQIIADALDFDLINGGLGGTGYTQVNGARPDFESRADDVINAINAAGPPEAVIFAGGINDGSFSDAAVQTAAANIFAAVRAGAPNCRIIVLGAFGNKNGYDAPTISRSAAIAGAASGVSDTHFIDVADIYSDPNWSTYYDGAETTHPNASGNIRMAEVLAPLIASVGVPAP